MSLVYPFLVDLSCPRTSEALFRFVPSDSPSFLLKSLSMSDLFAICFDNICFKKLSQFLTQLARLAVDVEISDNQELVIDTALIEVGALRSDQSDDFFCFLLIKVKPTFLQMILFFNTKDWGTSTCQCCSNYGPQINDHRWKYLFYPIHH